MSMTIGRASLNRVDSLDMDGDLISVGGTYVAASAAAAIATRERLNGYVDNLDEPAVPVTWTVDSSFDGYYEVVDASVTLDKERSYTGQFFCLWDATLRRLPGYATGLVEERFSGVVRANSHSITSGSVITYHGISSTGFNYSLHEVGDFIAHKYDIDAESGTDVRVVYSGAGLDHDFYLGQRNIRYAVTPANYYKNAATITISSEPVVGHQTTNTPTGWKLSTDIAKIEAGSTAGRLKHSIWRGNAWESVEFKLFWYDTSGGGTWNSIDTDPTQLTVIRNSPECVCVRLVGRVDLTALATDASIGPSFTVDLLMRRGSFMVEGFLTVADDPTGWGLTFGIGRAATEATSTMLGGIRATANDAAGNRFVLASPQTTSKDNTNGRIRQTTAAQTFPFMITQEPDGSGLSGSLPDSLHSATNQVYTYHAAHYSTQRIVPL